MSSGQTLNGTGGSPAQHKQCAQPRNDGQQFRSYFGYSGCSSVVIDPIRNSAGELIGFAKITRDITERKQAQEQLAQIQRQLAESQKLDALGQLTGGVAHDFNNLLMIIGGNINTLRRDNLNPKSIRALHAIDVAAQRAAAWRTDPTSISSLPTLTCQVQWTA